MNLPVLTTDRLELRGPTKDDSAPMHAIVSNAQTGRFLGPPRSFHDHASRFLSGAGSWLLHGYGPFMVRLRGREELIGNCGLFHSYRGLGEDFDDNAEAGWIIAAEHNGQGIASEAMTAVFDWFDRTHGPRRSVCMLSPNNTPSVRVARKLGFTPLRETEFNGEPVALLERGP
ncbi:GNAT family N-acetyltransferase [Tsuneonella sp. HG222]